MSNDTPPRLSMSWLFVAVGFFGSGDAEGLLGVWSSVTRPEPASRLPFQSRTSAAPAKNSTVLYAKPASRSMADQSTPTIKIDDLVLAVAFAWERC